MTRSVLAAAVLATAISGGRCGAAEAAGGPAADAPYLHARPEALERWRSWRFGLFVHWGPVSLKGTEIGWSRQGPRPGRSRYGRPGEIPMEEYDQLYKRFNPLHFNAGQWVQLAQRAGMRYLVFTAKHHDGFSMFDSKLTDYDIMETPYGRDICRQLADACHHHKFGLGWYYSPRDWRHPDFATERHDRYVKFYLGQIRELCSNYGRVDIFWFDGLDSPRELWGDAPERSFQLIRALQPDIVCNNRGGLPGDYDTPEQRIGAFNRERPWETCMTIGRQWAWKPDDQIKSLEQCVQTLLRVVGGDGNFLFNVGPMPDGRIEPRQAERLREMGRWLARYGEGVYGTRGGPFQPGAWGASTCQGDKIYLYVMKWPASGPLELPPLPLDVTDARLLGGGPVRVRRTDDALLVDPPPAEARDPIATPVVLTVDGRAWDIPPAPVARRRGALPAAKVAASNVYRKQPQYGPRAAIDGDDQTRWATDAGLTQAWIEIDLGQEKAIGGCWVREAFPGRIRRWRLERWDGADWTTITEGERLGADVDITFPPITARRVRLHILDAADGPTIYEFHALGPRRSGI